MTKLTKGPHTICRDTKYTQLEDPKKGSELGPLKPISNGNYWMLIHWDVRNSGLSLTFE